MLIHTLEFRLGGKVDLNAASFRFHKTIFTTK